MKMTGRLDGLDALRGALGRIAGDAELEAQVNAAAEEIREAARAGLADGQTPDSRSGALARSLTVEPAGDGKSAVIGTDLDYGWHLEFGSLARSATPWLEPALDEARPGVLSRFRSWLASSSKHARR